MAESGETRLTSADGTRFGAYAARPARPNGRGVVILPDIRGLHAFYRVLADLFADAGFDAVAFDYFGRTAETDERGESFDHRPHVPKVTPEHVELDVAASIAYLRSLPNPAEHLFTVGFCFGGAASWRQSAHGHGIAGAIGFYGGRPLERVGPWVPRMTAPLLMLLAGVDSTTPEEFDEFADLVRANGIEVESHTYPGAPHSFFDRSYADHRAACADAWERILDFTARRSGA